jgi:hypothetical protein
LLGQPFELLGLLRNSVRVSILIFCARVCSGLLDKLPDVLANNGDALLELGERRRAAVAHHVSPRSIFEWVTDQPHAGTLTANVSTALRRKITLRSALA